MKVTPSREDTEPMGQPAAGPRLSRVEPGNPAGLSLTLRRAYSMMPGTDLVDYMRLHLEKRGVEVPLSTRLESAKGGAGRALTRLRHKRRPHASRMHEMSHGNQGDKGLLLPPKHMHFWSR